MSLFQFSNDSMIVSETALKSREADYTFNTLILKDYYDEYRILWVVVFKCLSLIYLHLQKNLGDNWTFVDELLKLTCKVRVVSSCDIQFLNPLKS